MNMVSTVLGPISPGELGITLIHEHLICGRPGQVCDARDIPYDRDEIARTCLGALEEAKEHGVTTLVDATPLDLGNFPHSRVSEGDSRFKVCSLFPRRSERLLPIRGL